MSKGRTNTKPQTSLTPFMYQYSTGLPVGTPASPPFWVGLLYLSAASQVGVDVCGWGRRTSPACCPVWWDRNCDTEIELIEAILNTTDFGQWQINFVFKTELSAKNQIYHHTPSWHKIHRKTKFFQSLWRHINIFWKQLKEMSPAHE